MEITEDSVYDRQIRLWGHDAQRRMRNATVFVFGVDSINCEVIKNLVLAGINIVMCDAGDVTLEDTVGQYFVTEADIGKNVCRFSIQPNVTKKRAQASLSKLQELNSFCSISVCSFNDFDQIRRERAGNDIAIISAKYMDVNEIDRLLSSLTNMHAIVTWSLGTVSIGYLSLCSYFENWKNHLPLQLTRVSLPAMEAIVAGILSQELLRHFTEKPMSNNLFVFQSDTLIGQLTKIAP